MEHPISTERRPLSEWHRGGPERRLAGVCTALARELGVALPAVRAAFVLAVALPGIRVLAAGLYLALWIAAFAAAGWRRLLTGLALLGLVQVATLVALHVLASHAGFAPHVRDVRAWAVVGPLLVVLAVVRLDWRRRRPTPVTAAAGSGAGG